MKFYFFRIEVTEFFEFDNLKLKGRLVGWGNRSGLSNLVSNTLRVNGKCNWQKYVEYFTKNIL